jgi:hypothetical protein
MQFSHIHCLGNTKGKQVGEVLEQEAKLFLSPTWEGGKKVVHWEIMQMRW